MFRLEIVWFGDFVKMVHIEISVVMELFFKNGSRRNSVVREFC
jgi:hypothetical protein